MAGAPKMIGGVMRFSKSKITLLLVGLIFSLTSLIIACGGDEAVDDDSTSDVSDQSNSLVSVFSAEADEDFSADDELANELVNTEFVDRGMAPVLVDPIVEPEIGSDEAAILEVFERQVLAFNQRDPGAFIKTCDPRLAKVNVHAAIERLWSTYLEPSAPGQSYNRRFVEVKVFKGEFANVSSKPYSYDEPFFSQELSGSFTDSWVKVDGEWYISNVMCHNGNRKLIGE